MNCLFFQGRFTRHLWFQRMYPIFQEDVSLTFLYLRKFLCTNEWNTDRNLCYAVNNSWKLRQRPHLSVAICRLSWSGETAQKKWFCFTKCQPQQHRFLQELHGKSNLLKESRITCLTRCVDYNPKKCNGRDYLYCYCLWHTIPENTTSCQKPHHARIPTHSITFPNVLQRLELGSSIWLKRSAIRPVMFGCLGAAFLRPILCFASHSKWMNRSDCHSQNITWHKQMMISNSNLLFQGFVFRCFCCCFRWRDFND